MGAAASLGITAREARFNACRMGLRNAIMTLKKGYAGGGTSG